MIIQSKTYFDKNKDNSEDEYFKARERLAKQITDYIIDNNLISTREDFNICRNKWELIGYIELKER